MSFRYGPIIRDHCFKIDIEVGECQMIDIKRLEQKVEKIGIIDTTYLVIR